MASSVSPAQVTVCCGSTEAMLSTLLAVLDPGRRGRHLRAVLRELRPRQHHLRRGARASCGCASPTGRSTSRSWPRRSTIGRARSSSTRRTTRRGRSSPGRSCSSSRSCARSGTCSRSPTRSTSTSSTTATRTSRSRRSTAWPIARSPSTGCRRRSASPAGGWAGRSRPPIWPGRFERCTTS